MTYRIARLNARLNAQAVRILKVQGGGMSLTQWRIFVLLGAYGEQTAAEIARRSFIDKAQVSRAVRGMVSDGFLRQRPDPRDRRARTLSVTAKGARLAAKARPHMESRQARIRSSLTEGEISCLLAALDGMENSLEEPPR